MNIISKLAMASSFLVLATVAVNAQTTSPSTADPPAQQKGAQPQPPKTTGAMDNTVGNLATSPEDVKRQTEGQPTTAQEAKGATATNPKPGITEQSPGTVGAAPGANPAPGEKK
jgi:hypothetical protein